MPKRSAEIRIYRDDPLYILSNESYKPQSTSDLSGSEGILNLSNFLKYGIIISTTSPLFSAAQGSRDYGATNY